MVFLRRSLIQWCHGEGEDQVHMQSDGCLLPKPANRSGRGVYVLRISCIVVSRIIEVLRVSAFLILVAQL